jgi:hypothetical protein
MKRVLVLEYSQSGDVAKIADAFVRPLEHPDVEVRRERIQPVVPYPYPWRSIERFFSVFPECFVGSANGIRPLSFDPEDRFDLVILAYQVWFLSPSIPIQAFFRSEYASVLKGTPVVTLCVSRNMWHSASETMKRLLKAAGAIHLDNVTVTHQGPPFSTLVSVPRALLYGKRDRLWGIFPPADLSQQELDRAGRLGAAISSRLSDLRAAPQPLLAGLGAVKIIRRYVVPELLGWYIYRAAAGLVARAGHSGERARRLAISLFIANLLIMVLVAMPLFIAVVFVLSPLLHGRISRYMQQLAEPSGEAPATDKSHPNVLDPVPITLTGRSP